MPCQPSSSHNIRRLELLAVHSGVRVAEYLALKLRVTVRSSVLWNDSKCVLNLLTTRRVLSVFVENRLCKIKSPGNLDFLYFSSRVNPADLGSRGCHLSVLVVPSENWPSSEWIIHTDALQQARTEWRKTDSLFGTSGFGCQVIPVSPFSIAVDRYSSFRRLLRVTATCMLALSVRGDAISMNDMLDAQLKWYRFVQRAA